MLALAEAMGSLAQSQSPRCALVLECAIQDDPTPSACDVLPLSASALPFQHHLQLRWVQSQATAAGRGRRLLCQGPRTESEEARAYLQPYFGLAQVAQTEATKVRGNVTVRKDA